MWYMVIHMGKMKWWELVALIEMDYFILIYDTLSLSSRLQKKCREKEGSVAVFHY